MPVPSVDSQTPHVIEFATPAEVNSGGQVVITPESMATEGAREVWLPLVFTHSLGTIAPVTVPMPSPIAGTFIGLRAVATAQPSGTISFAPTIGGTPVTDGTVSITSSDAAGTVKSSTATGANTVMANQTSVLVSATTAASGSMRITVLVGFRRS